MIFTELTGKKDTLENTESVSEGWEVIFFKIFSAVSPFPISLISKNVPIIWSKSNMKRILTNSELVKYLRTQCDEIFKKAKHKDHSVQRELPSGMVHGIREKIFMDYNNTFKKSSTKYWRNNTSNNEFLEGYFSGYAIIVEFDIKHIQSIRVVLYSAERDKYFSKEIPAPRSMKSLGFYKDK